MNKQQIIDRLNSPDKILLSDCLILKDIVSKYPYFQTAQLLYLQSLSKGNDNIAFEKQLRLTSAQSINRKIIFELLRTQKNEEQKKAEKANLAIEEEPKIVEEKKPEPIIETKKEEVQVKKETDKSTELLEQVRKRLAEIEAEKTASTIESSEKQLIEEGKNIEIKSKEKIIDDFIKEEPRIKPRDDDFSEIEKIANQSNLDKGDFISETLAEIYVKQGNKDKGIEIYKKLCLKFPEKSSYFAAQIKKVENKSKT